MSDTNSPEPFGKEHAKTYDEQFARLAPMKDALHLTSRFALDHLPSDASLLISGAGTGAELLYLAEAFPGWTFTALDVSEPMLERCRAAAGRAGITERCRFVHGPVSSLPDAPAFDGATSFLVAHFLMELEERRAYFRAIATRLRPGGRLLTADLCFDPHGPSFPPEFELWKRMLRFSGATAERAEAWADELGKRLRVYPRQEHADLLRSAGFEGLHVYCQTLWIHGWIADRV